MSKIEYVQADGARIGYRDDGDGPALVLVHGTGGDGEDNWGEVLRGLPGRRILRSDYAGSGLTEDATERLTLDRLADQVLAAADHAGVETFDLAGFSLGAAVALRIAARHPDRVRRLVSLGGFVTGGDPRSRLQFDHWVELAGRDREALARLILLTGFSADFVAGMGDLDAVVAQMVEVTHWEGMARQAMLDKIVDVSADLAAIRAPTLVLGNRHDQMVPPSASVALAAGIAGARLGWIDGPHLSPMECPEAVAAAIAGFLGASG
ncbi:alpha/beta fold hydrolase [Salipiger abyssi]|uniref:Putative hydrolase or acyltransferase of alpha/beta superfamily n=1 Tax=Salipiger abyssi TaxID=1250539 RepID=A0A1P8UPI6_9RHOB|nr:alpha/beta fold hydrolase [Salipiger abyssi]APZ51316.1 putative hydrolase or acyltransferase of alpha/beta superfamily [Salipiger abyssi]